MRQMSFKDLKKNYTPISAEDVSVCAEIRRRASILIDSTQAKASWVAEHAAGDDNCLHKASDKCPGANCDFGKRTQRCNCLATNSLLHTICKAQCIIKMWRRVSTMAQS